MLDWLRRRADQPPTIELDGRTLPITLRRLPNARRLTLRLARDGSEVRLSMPPWAPTAEALAFVRSRQGWLAAQLARHAAPVALADGAALPFRGAPHILRHAPALPRRVQVAGGEIRLGGETSSLRPRLTRWMQGEARALFAADLAHYTAAAGVEMPLFALSAAQARWGSCSAARMVRLNWRLVMAPDFVRRSVVAHEVTHLVHFNHSPAFHALLAALFEHDINEADGWLRRHGRALYAPLG